MVLFADFDLVCSCSCSLIALRKCGVDTVGRATSKKGSRLLGSQVDDIQRLVDLYEKVQIFPCDSNEPRKMSHNFFLG